MSLPTDPKARKAIPLYSGLVKYFPDALIAVAQCSYRGNAQHNGPDAPLEWDRSKSSDHLDCELRHLFDHAMGVQVDTDQTEHLTKNAWRALAALQVFLESKAENDRSVTNLCPESPK